MPTLKIEILYTISGKGEHMMETREAYINGELTYKEEAKPIFFAINNNNPISNIRDYLTGNLRKEGRNRISYTQYIINSIKIRWTKLFFKYKQFCV